MKGKHTHAAATRRAFREAETEIQTYQRRVVELTAENKRLRSEADERTRAHASEVRRLRAERNEGVSPMLGVVQSENARLKDELDHAKREVRQMKERWDNCFRRVADHFREEHRAKGIEQVEQAAGLMVASLSGTGLVDGALEKSHLPDEAKAQIQRARGERSGQEPPRLSGLDAANQVASHGGRS